jgi:hypothetical protein
MKLRPRDSFARQKSHRFKAGKPVGSPHVYQHAINIKD